MSTFGKVPKEARSPYQDNHYKELNQRFNRWHDKQMALLTFLINLFFSFSVVSIGYVWKVLQEDLDGSIWFKQITATNLISTILLVSIVLGASCLIVRLSDFRATTKKVKCRKRLFILENELKYTSPSQWDQSELKCSLRSLESITKRLGTATHVLFIIQVLSFLTALTLIYLSL